MISPSLETPENSSFKTSSYVKIPRLSASIVISSVVKIYFFRIKISQCSWNTTVFILAALVLNENYSISLGE